MNADYWKGFRDGQKHGEKKAAELLAFYLESLKEVPGIGEKTYQKIAQHINTVSITNRNN
jgi:recombinational DNA repair protein RecR